MDRRKTDRRNEKMTDLLVLDFKEVLKTLWRRKLLIAIFTTSMLIPCAVFIYLKPNEYKAIATLVLENEQFNLSGLETTLPHQKLESADIDTQVKILKSPSLSRETIESITGRDPSYEELRDFIKSLSVSAEGKSRVISVSYVAESPYDAVTAANAHAQEFVELQIRNRHEKVSAINTWIENQIDILKKSSQKKIEEIQAFKTKSGINQAENSQELLEKQILDLAAQLAPVETQKMFLQAKMEAEKGKHPIVENSEIIENLKLQSSLAKQELSSLQAKYGINHPAYVSAQNRYNQALSDLTREQNASGDDVAIEFESIAQQEAMMRQRLEDLNKKADSLRTDQAILESMEAEATASRTLLDNFLSRAEETRSQLSLNNPAARIESKAEIPTEVDGVPKSSLFFLLFAFCLIFGTIITLILELADRGIEHEDDVKKHLNVKLLGVLTRIRKQQNTDFLLYDKYLEEIKRIYMSFAMNKDLQTILFTSPEEQAGKSTAALSFVRYLNSINVPAILINADRFSLAPAEIQGESGVAGLAEAMNNNIKIEQSIQKSNTIDFISIGKSDVRSIDFLSSKKILDILDTLKNKYRYVVMDCSSMNTSPDAEILSAHVDEVVVVAEWSKTTKEKLKKSISSLKQFSKNAPSVLMNKR